jgi:hypothetical protein
VDGNWTTENFNLDAVTRKWKIREHMLENSFMNIVPFLRVLNLIHKLKFE